VCEATNDAMKNLPDGRQAKAGNKNFINHKLKNKTMKVAVVGATGLVGTKMLQVLAERNFPVTELLPVASERSVGKEVEFKGKNLK